MQLDVRHEITDDVDILSSVYPYITQDVAIFTVEAHVTSWIRQDRSECYDVHTYIHTYKMFACRVHKVPKGRVGYTGIRIHPYRTYKKRMPQ